MTSATTTNQPSRPLGLTSSLDDDDREIIEAGKRALKYGVELRKWWEEIDRTDAYTDRYPESYVFHRPDDVSFGFFETSKGKTLGEVPVIGNVQGMRYDLPKGSSKAQEKQAPRMRKQIEEFILKYFMRVSDYREPQQLTEHDHPELPKVLRYFSNCPTDEYKAQGFGYSQHYYKLKNGGKEGNFPIRDPNRNTEEAGNPGDTGGQVITPDAIIDLRRLKDTYDWIIVKNPITDFGFSAAPLGVRGPQIKIPIPAANYLILSADTITCETYEDGERSDGVIGRYGIGYAFVKDVGKPGLFAYGPGQLEPALQLLIWEVKNTGEVTVRMTFVSRAPEGLFNVSVNPVQWGFKLADFFSLGVATPFLAPMKNATDRLPFADLSINPIYPTVGWLNQLTGNAPDEYFCISERQINKELLYIHFLEHYHAVMGSVETWRQFGDWTVDEKKLPDWVRTGVSM